MGLGLGRALPGVAREALNQASGYLRKGLSPCRTGRRIMRGNGKPPNGLAAALFGQTRCAKGRVAGRPNERGASYGSGEGNATPPSSRLLLLRPPIGDRAVNCAMSPGR